MKIEAPFTDAQVKHLNAWQANPQVHPFTCTGERYDLAHVKYARDAGQRDMGILIAATWGWRCPVCGYRQAWAHDFMARPIPPMSVLLKSKPKSRRGFAGMDPEKRRAIARKGGSSVPAEKRSFSKDRELAVASGAKGGSASRNRKKPRK